MKKGFKLLSLLLGALLALSCFALAACGGSDDNAGNGGNSGNNGGNNPPAVTPQKTCLVQVEGGTGGGYYYVDTNCTVKAEVPNGKQFMKWVSGTTDLSPNAEYTFTVTKNINIKAVFEDDIPGTELYTVDVKWGSGSGNYFAGKKINVAVYGEYPGATFTGWEATYKDANGENVTEKITDKTSFEFTVDKNISIKACYDATPLPTPDNSNGQMFKVQDSGAYAFDRQKTETGANKTAIVPGCAFLLYNAYVKDENNEYVLVGQGKVVPLGYVEDSEYWHYLYSMDGKKKVRLKGQAGNIYQDLDADKTVIREILNLEVNKVYYITAQAKGGDDTPIDSDESVPYEVKM